MNREELAKTFMMILNLKNPLFCDVFYKLIQRFKGWRHWWNEWKEDILTDIWNTSNYTLPQIYITEGGSG